MQIFPNITAAFVSKAGNVLKPWIQYLQQFTVAPPAGTQLTLTASPFSYTTVEPGNLVIVGGTISSILLIRGNLSLNITGSKIIPISVNDTVKITYSVLPAVYFLPNYGASTQT